MLTRFDQSLAGRQSSFQFSKNKLGAQADGTVAAFEMDAYGTAGLAPAGQAQAAAANFSIADALHLSRCPNTRVKHCVAWPINAGSARAFRAPNHPPASFGMESIMDELAVKLNMDPVELRIKNNERRMPRRLPREIREKEFHLGAEKFGWKEKYKKPGSSPGPIKTGVGCASRHLGRRRRAAHKPKRRSIPTAASRFVAARRILGTGTKTLIAVIAAEILGVEAGTDHARDRRHEFSAIRRQRRQHDRCVRLAGDFRRVHQGAANSCRRNQAWPMRAATTGWPPARSSGWTRWSFRANGSMGFPRTAPAACNSPKSRWIPTPASSR